MGFQGEENQRQWRDLSRLWLLFPLAAGDPKEALPRKPLWTISGSVPPHGSANFFFIPFSFIEEYVGIKFIQYQTISTPRARILLRWILLEETKPLLKKELLQSQGYFDLCGGRFRALPWKPANFLKKVWSKTFINVFRTFEKCTPSQPLPLISSKNPPNHLARRTLLCYYI